MKAPEFPEAVLSELSAAVARNLGLHFPREQWSELVRGMTELARASGGQNVESLMRQFSSLSLTAQQIGLLASHLTVGETYFLREPAILAALRDHVLPDLIRAGGGTTRPLRIWSAGCSTGEEPYTVAMLLDRLLPAEAKRNVAILGTDVNPQILRQADQGIYGEWSFRCTPAWIRQEYFSRRPDGRFEIRPHIRQLVTFSRLNLATDAYPSPANNTAVMDVILCRNVLMYFTSSQAKRVVENFHRALADGGWLIVSPVETSNTLYEGFETVNFPDAVLYLKGKGAGRSASAIRVAQTAASGLREKFEFSAGTQSLPGSGAGQPVAWMNAPETAGEESAPAPKQQKEPEQTGCEALVRQARLHADEGRLEEAIEWCEKAIAADKLNAALHYLLATIQRENGNASAAARSLRHALYLDQDFVLAHFALGNLCLSAGRHRNAARHFGNALKLLRSYSREDIVPQSGGLTAGRLDEIIASAQSGLEKAEAGGA